MKIGEIARMAGITVNAVRYYINLGLLVPKSRNKQYVFSQEDLEDLHTILKLKKLHFALEDIHKILSLKRVTNLTDRGDIKDYLNFFARQKSALLIERKALDEAISGIKEEMANIQSEIEDNHFKSGVPINMLSLIYCPHCQKPLNLKDAYIENQYVISGAFFCECGYTAEIKEGILVTTGGFISNYDYPDLERSFYKNIPATFITLLQKSYNWLLERIDKAKRPGNVVYEDHMNAYFFLYRHIELMDPDAYYIVSDKYFEIVKMYKERLDKLNLRLNILFIKDATFEPPLKNGCIDMYLDYFSSNEFTFFNHHYHMDKLERYFHSGTQVLGTYFYFKPGSRSLRQAVMDYPETWEHNFDLQYFHKHFTANGRFLITAEDNIGYVTDSGASLAFTFHIKGEEMHLFSYHWQKK